MLKGYERGLDFVLAHRFLTCWSSWRRSPSRWCCSSYIPKGFFPQQDTGLLTGISDMAQDTSFGDLMTHQAALGEIVQDDPAVDHVASAVGGNGNALNTGRMFITLKPRNQRDVTADQIIRRLQPKLDQVEGAKLYLQAAQDVRVGGRASRTQYQYTLQDSDLDELNQWSPKVLAKLKTLPELRDVATDQQIAGTTLTLKVDRDQASRYGISMQTIDDTLYDAFGQRQIAQYFTQLSSYYVIMEVLPAAAGRFAVARQDLSQVADHQRRGAALGLRQVDHRSGQAAVDQPPEPVPGRSRSASTSRRAWRSARRPMRSIARSRRSACRPTIQTSFQGNAQAFQASLSTVPLLILGAAGGRLSGAGRALRELHPPDHDPVDPAVGRRRRAR